MQPQQYPPQGYPAQPGYAPQPQQQYAPPQYGQPYPQQGYPQPAPAAPPAAPAPGYGGAHPQGHDPFAAPAPPQSSIVRPRLLDFGRDPGGRLVLITPTDIKRGVPNRLSNKPGDTQDRMTCDLVVLDGNAFPYGGAPEKGQPHTLLATVPCEIPSMWISNVGLIGQVERRMNEPVLGRLVIEPLDNGNTIYRLKDATEAEKQVARQYLVDKQAGLIQPPAHPVATQPYAGPPPQQAQPQYAPPPQAPQYAPPQAPPGYELASQQQYAAGAQPQQYAVPQGQQPPAPPAWAPPVQQVNLDVPVPPYTPEQWMGFPPEQRQLIAGAYAAQQRPGI